MANFSQDALQTYVMNRNKPSALLELAASVTPAEAKAAPKTITLGTPKAAKPKGGGKGKPGQIFELFYDPQGGWKNGSSIGAIGDHTDHVHVAADTKRVIYLGKLAKKMGLSVGENKYFSGSTPTGGHAPNSWHYKNEAIDVSGDAKRMAAFARLVRRQYHLK